MGRFFRVDPADIPLISRISNIPTDNLDENLRHLAYTRAGTSGRFTTVFVKIPQGVHEPATGSTWQLFWDDLLVVYDQNSVMTFSKSMLPVLDRVVKDGRSEGIVLSGPGIIYLIVRDSSISLRISSSPLRSSWRTLRCSR